MTQFVTYKDNANEHRWRVVGENGEVIGAASEGFSSKAASNENAMLLTDALATKWGAPFGIVAEHLRPNAMLLCKLASIIVHSEEALEPGGHEFDLAAWASLRQDAEVEEWLEAMGRAGMLPVKREQG